MSNELSENPCHELAGLVREIDVAATLAWIRSREHIAINGDPLDPLPHVDLGCAEIDGSQPTIESGYLTLLVAEESGLKSISAILTGDEQMAQRLGLSIQGAVA